MSFRATVVSKCREYPNQIDVRLTSATVFCRLRKGPQRVLRRLSHCTPESSQMPPNGRVGATGAYPLGGRSGHRVRSAFDPKAGTLDLRITQWLYVNP